jgi:hypothetical protein
MQYQLVTIKDTTNGLFTRAIVDENDMVKTAKCVSIAKSPNGERTEVRTPVVNLPKEIFYGKIRL